MAQYIDKLEFHNNLKKYKETECPKAYEKIGKSFLLIAQNYLNRPFYINYSPDWKDDMISEAVFDMCRYIDNYDVEELQRQWEEYGKKPDPFSYFSQYVFNGIMRFLGYKKKDKDVLVRLPFIENIDKREASHD